MDKKTTLDVFRFQRGYLSLLVDDIADEQLAAQPGGFVNHPAWQLGHLAVVADNMCGLLGGKATLDKSWSERYGWGSKPAADRGSYPSKAELLRTLDDRRATAATLLAEASDAFMREPNPNPTLAPMLPTRAHMATFMMVFHEGTHMGQLAAWRKCAGMVEALSKLA